MVIVCVPRYRWWCCTHCAHERRTLRAGLPWEVRYLLPLGREYLRETQCDYCQRRLIHAEDRT